MLSVIFLTIKFQKKKTTKKKAVTVQESLDVIESLNILIDFDDKVKKKIIIFNFFIFKKKNTFVSASFFLLHKSLQKKREENFAAWVCVFKLHIAIPGIYIRSCIIIFN